MSTHINSLLDSLTEKMRLSAESAKHIVVPVSGGSDSALLFYLLNQIFPHKVIGIYVGKNLREEGWFSSTGNLQVLDLKLSSFDPQTAEIYRWAMFLDFSLKYSGWLTSSRTRTENVLGTYSLASRVATYLPLLNTWKSDVMLMCEAVGVPKSITDSSREADPDCGRPSEMAAIKLEDIDNYLKFSLGFSVSTSVTSEQATYLQNIVNGNKFKQKLPISH